MSNKLRDHAYELALPFSVKAVLLVLADHANRDGGGARPSRTTIARKTGLSESTVAHAITELYRRRLIVRVGGGHRGAVTEYQLTLWNGDHLRPRQAGLFVMEANNPPERMGAATGALSGVESRAERVPETPRKGAANDPLNPPNPPRSKNLAATRRRDEAFEALCAVTYTNTNELTRSARGAANRALADIREASPDLNGSLPAEIRTRAARWPFGVRLTPTALAKHWPQLGADAPPPTTGRESAGTRLLRQAAARRAAEAPRGLPG